jgi:hypothetical protein
MLEQSRIFVFSTDQNEEYNSSDEDDDDEAPRFNHSMVGTLKEQSDDYPQV